MPADLLLTLVTVFASVALLVGALASMILSRSAATRRLSELTSPTTTGLIVVAPTGQLTGDAEPLADRIVDLLPTSRGTVKRLRRDMALAGFYTAKEAAIFSVSEVISPLIGAGVGGAFFGVGSGKWVTAFLGAVVGYMIPGLWLRFRTGQRKREIENGLADALDLLVLCLEAGSSLDQSLVKAGDELEVAYPVLGEQLRVVISEMRAGKPRLEAFRGLATRTQVDDVQSLVAMLVQTDRFGTSIAQALRTHADVCRTKRRQRAEERAQKVGVKLVFPLVFCLFPALYVVMLGPAYLQFMTVFGTGK